MLLQPLLLAGILPGPQGPEKNQTGLNKKKENYLDGSYASDCPDRESGS